MTAIIPLDPHRDEDVELATAIAKGLLGFALGGAEHSHEAAPTLVAAISAFIRALDKDHHPGVKLGTLAALAQDFTDDQIATAIRTFRQGTGQRLPYKQ